MAFCGISNFIHKANNWDFLQVCGETSNIEDLPNELFVQLADSMQFKTWYKISAVSKTFHERVFAYIRSNATLFNHLCSQLITKKNRASVESALTALASVKLDFKLHIRLTVDAHYLHEKSAQYTIHKIAELFQGIDSLKVIDEIDNNLERYNRQKTALPIPPCRVLTLCSVPVTQFLLPELEQLSHWKVSGCSFFPSDNFLHHDRLRHFIRHTYEDQYQEWGDDSDLELPEGMDIVFDEYYSEYVREAVQLLSSRFIPLKLALACFEAPDTRAIEFCREVLSQKGDIAEAHFLLAERLSSLSPEESKRHYKIAANLYLQEGDVQGLLWVAKALDSKKLHNSAYRLIGDYDEFRRVIELFGTDLERLWATRDERPWGKFAKKALKRCAEEQNVAGLIFLSFIRHDEDFEAAKEAESYLKELAPELVPNVQALEVRDPFKYLVHFINLFFEKGLSIDELVRPWFLRQCREAGSQSLEVKVYEYLVGCELEGGVLHNLSYFSKYLTIEQKRFLAATNLLHRLEAVVRAQSADIYEIIDEMYEERFDYIGKWQFFLFLHQHKLFPSHRIKLLQTIVDATTPFNTIPDAKKFPIDDKTSLLTWSDEKSLYKACRAPVLIPINARIALESMQNDKELEDAFKGLSL